MGRVPHVGIVMRDFVHNTFAYTFSSLLQSTSNVFEQFVTWMNSHFVPFVSNNSTFVLAGAIGFTALSTTMFLSNAVFDAKRELLRLADASKVTDDTLAAFRKEMAKDHENIYVFTNRKLTQQQLHDSMDDIMSLCGLDEPHFQLGELIASLKKLNYYISFHDHSELQIKDALLQRGWNFNLINQAFTVIDMELYNTIAGAYEKMTQFEIAEAMKTVKELAVQGYTTKKIEKYMLDAGHDRRSLSKIFASIHKVQKMHDDVKKAKERRIRKAIRMNQAHPSRVASGRFNS